MLLELCLFKNTINPFTHTDRFSFVHNNGWKSPLTVVEVSLQERSTEGQSRTVKLVFSQTKQGPDIVQLSHLNSYQIKQLHL